MLYPALGSMLPCPIYRAEAVRDAMLDDAPRQPRASLRLPSNVPYVVDNLWEFLRPEGMPSRRHALYASPSRELARKNRTGSDRGEGFCVYRVVIEGPTRVAQIGLPDARRHRDIKAVQALLQASASDIAQAPDDEKPLLALLFMPGAAAADWERARDGSPLADQLVTAMCAASTFWQEASPQPDPDSDGELFFQLDPGATYRAVDLERYREP